MQDHKAKTELPIVSLNNRPSQFTFYFTSSYAQTGLSENRLLGSSTHCFTDWREEHQNLSFAVCFENYQTMINNTEVKHGVIINSTAWVTELP